MFETILDFVLKYKIIILFYLVLGVIIFIYRKRFETQAKVILLLRTKWGIAWMDRVSEKYREWIILLGYIGIGVGFIGMGLIAFLLIKNLYDLMTVPTAVNTVSLVVPGISIPGLGVLEFWHWIIMIFIIAVVHEFAHGVVARAHNVEVKNTGFVLFGPILGAFVEPNEKKMSKEKDTVQYSILAAGAFSNVILALLALLILSVVIAPTYIDLNQQTQESVGFTFDKYDGKDLPIEKAGIKPGTLVMRVDGQRVNSFAEAQTIISSKKPGDSITLTADGKDYIINLTSHPQDNTRAYMGVYAPHDVRMMKEEYVGTRTGFYFNIIDEARAFFSWLSMLSLGIGLFNLLPLPIVDGGRMVQTFMRKLKGQVVGDKVYIKIGFFFLFLLALNLTYQYIAQGISYLLNLIGA